MPLQAFWVTNGEFKTRSAVNGKLTGGPLQSGGQKNTLPSFDTSIVWTRGFEESQAKTCNQEWYISEDFSLLVTFLLVTFSWLFRGLFRGFFVALICLEKQCLGVFRGFFVALILGKFYAYSPWKSLLNIDLLSPSGRLQTRVANAPTPHSIQKFGRSQTGVFSNRGVSHFFRERSRLCRGPFRDCSFLVGALNRPRKRKRTNQENPRTIPEQIGKILEKSGKDKKGRTSPDREAPRFEIPPFGGP